MATKPFGGKETKGEEKAEARLVRSGKLTPAQYVKDEKKEGDKAKSKTLLSRGKAMASGKLSPNAYANMSAKGMKNGGMVKGKC